jgi:hypothetical protein
MKISDDCDTPLSAHLTRAYSDANATHQMAVITALWRTTRHATTSNTCDYDELAPLHSEELLWRKTSNTDIRFMRPEREDACDHTHTLCCWRLWKMNHVTLHTLWAYAVSYCVVPSSGR